MTDFIQADKALIETFSSKAEDTNLPLSFAPKIPNIKFDSSIPESVKISMSVSQALATSQRTEERMRQDGLIKALEEGNSIINNAEQKIETSQNHIFGELIGLFSDDYDVSEQQRRIKSAARNVQTKVATSKIESFKDQLELKDSVAEYETYVKTQALKGKKVALTSAELNMIVTQNTARKAAQDFAFSQLSADDMLAVKKSGKFTEIVTEQRIDKYLIDIEKSQLDIQSSQLAYKGNKLELGQKMEARAIEGLPIQFLQQQLDKAVKAGEGRVQLSKDFFVSHSKIQKMITTKNQTAEAFRKQNAQQAIKFSQQNADFNGIQKSMQMLSSDFFQGDIDQDLSVFNMLNVTDETLVNVDFNAIHPSVASDYMALMSHYANFNESNVPTEQDAAIGRELQEKLKTKIDTLKKQEMDAQPDKQAKAALQEWHNNFGRMTTGQNSATIVANNVTVMPNFRGDNALEQAYLVFQHNMLEDLEGTTVDIMDEKGVLDTQAFFQNALSKSLRGKQTNSQVVLRVINKINSAGQSALSTYANTKSAEVVLNAIRNLAEKDPAIKASLLDANGNPTELWSAGGAQNHNALANELARLSSEALKADPTTTPNELNFLLQNEINAIIGQSAAGWNRQMNIGSGSFMVNLFSNKQPHQIVDTAIGISWSQHVNRAWEAQVVEPMSPASFGFPPAL